MVNKEICVIVRKKAEFSLSKPHSDTELPILMLPELPADFLIEGQKIYIHSMPGGKREWLC